MASIRSGIVCDYRLLNGMERAGFIETRPGYDRHWTGTRVRNYFVHAGPKLPEWYTPFEYKGVTYRLRYFDGCFHPFVTVLGSSVPSFI